MMYYCGQAFLPQRLCRLEGRASQAAEPPAYPTKQNKEKVSNGSKIFEMILQFYRKELHLAVRLLELYIPLVCSGANASCSCWSSQTNEVATAHITSKQRRAHLQKHQRITNQLFYLLAEKFMNLKTMYRYHVHCEHSPATRSCFCLLGNIRSLCFSWFST